MSQLKHCAIALTEIELRYLMYLRLGVTIKELEAEIGYVGMHLSRWLYGIGTFRDAGYRVGLLYINLQADGKLPETDTMHPAELALFAINGDPASKHTVMVTPLELFEILRRRMNIRKGDFYQRLGFSDRNSFLSIVRQESVSVSVIKKILQVYAEETCENLVTKTAELPVVNVT